MIELGWHCGMHGHVSGLKLMRFGSQPMTKSQCEETFRYMAFVAFPGADPVDVKVIIYSRVKIAFVRLKILDRHHAWRSLDLTLDICSNFMKKNPFTSFFASF